MGYTIDPEGNETRALHALCSFDGMDVLEVGCGNGRMTWRYADQARSVLALDPNAMWIDRATASTPEALKPHVTFRVADIVDARLPKASFDAAILSWCL
jgi:ubiquinone/menaquinone biosynthesis C-methylase UbiE